MIERATAFLLRVGLDAGPDRWVCTFWRIALAFFAVGALAGLAFGWLAEKG